MATIESPTPEVGVFAYCFTVLSCQVSIHVDTPDVLELLRCIWPNTPAHDAITATSLSYALLQTPNGYTLQRADTALVIDSDLSTLLHTLDKDILVFLQQQHPALYFLHGAVLQRNNKAILLTGSSGAGKSTLCFALTTGLHKNTSPWAAMSDELAPVCSDSASVYPYYRALGLKSPPPTPAQLPPNCIRTPRSIHIPAATWPAPQLVATPLCAIFSVQGQFANSYAEGEQLSKTDASLIILRNLLNGLAHPASGLVTAIALAEHIPCFNLPRLPLPQACRLVEDCWTSLDV